MIFQYFPITTVSHPLTIPWSAHQVALSDMELRLNASAKKRGWHEPRRAVGSGDKRAAGASESRRVGLPVALGP